MNHKLIALTAVIVILLSGFILIYRGGNNNRKGQQSATKDTSINMNKFKNISPKELLDMLSQKEKDYTLINVHVPYIGEIANTDEFIAFNEIQDNLDKLPTNKNAKIVLYCQSGGMSAIAAQTLVGLGYTNIENLSGGMIGWKKDGYTLEYNNTK